jgi:hypothetical protein
MGFCGLPGSAVAGKADSRVSVMPKKGNYGKICFLVLALVFALWSFPSSAADDLRIYDRDWKLRGHVKGGRIYDQNWERKGQIKGDRVYDEDRWLKYQIRGERVYDRDGEPAGYIKDGKIYGREWERRGQIKESR